MVVQRAAFTTITSGDPTKRLVQDGETLERMINFLSQQKAIVVDYETSGVTWYRHSDACGVGLGSWDNNGTFWSGYVPFAHKTGEPQLDKETVCRAFLPLLANPDIMKISHNIKFEDHFTRKLGGTIEGPRYDTMIAARLFDENREMGLEKRAAQDLNDKTAFDQKILLDQEVKRLARENRLKIKEYKYKYGYSEVSIYQCGLYGNTDVHLTGGLFQFYEKWGLSGRYPRIWPTEMALTEALCDMEQNGLLVDVDYLTGLRAMLQDEKEKIEAMLKESLGLSMINPASDQEVAWLLTKAFHLPLTKRTKANALSVDAEVLESFANHHPSIQMILDWREAEKLLSTYTQSILDKMDDNNIVHGDLQQVGTNTGRLSCKAPNYQNMPSESEKRSVAHTGMKLEEGGIDPWSIRRAFVVPGWNTGQAPVTRLFMDYSQVELRVIAWYSQDPIMMQAFLDGEDIHKRTALEVFPEYDKDARRKAKVINFGLCIAEGEEVLTDHGLVPIEEVRCWHKVWDGVEWVSHDGVVCNGEKEVITHEGLTATPDHEIYTQEGERKTLREIASCVDSQQIAVGAVGETPVRYSTFDEKNQSSSGWEPREECEVRRSTLYRLSQKEVGVIRQHQIWQDQELQLSKGQVPRSTSKDVGDTLRRYGAALREEYSRIVSSIQGAWYQSLIQVPRTFHSVGVGNVSRLELQGIGFRSDRQRWSLQSEESQVGRSNNQSQQQRKKTKVYDLLNAGPRHRFTVSGKIVSNSYGMSEIGFAHKTGISIDEASSFLQRFFDRFSGIARFKESLYRYIRANPEHSFNNLHGRTRRLPNIVHPDKYVRARAERQAIATLIQGEAAELTKESIVRIHKWIKANNVPMQLKNTVHDEIQGDVDTNCLRDVIGPVTTMMEDYSEFAPIKIIADAEWSQTNWADKQAWKAA